MKPRCSGLRRVARDYRASLEVSPSLMARTVGVKIHPGDVAHSTLFACGDLRGRVYIWDLRNIKQPASQVSLHSPTASAQLLFLHLQQVKCFQTEIRNVIWHESHILASSDDNSMAAIPYNYTNSVV